MPCPHVLLCNIVNQAEGSAQQTNAIVTDRSEILALLPFKELQDHHSHIPAYAATPTNLITYQEQSARPVRTIPRFALTASSYSAQTSETK